MPLPFPSSVKRIDRKNRRPRQFERIDNGELREIFPDDFGQRPEPTEECPMYWDQDSRSDMDSGKQEA
jgi:hypothetical protein